MTYHVSPHDSMDRIAAEQITLLIRNERELVLRALRTEADALRTSVSKQPPHGGIVVRECEATRAVGR
jgi:hypothetical protein